MGPPKATCRSMYRGVSARRRCAPCRVSRLSVPRALCLVADPASFRSWLYFGWCTALAYFAPSAVPQNRLAPFVLPLLAPPRLPCLRRPALISQWAWPRSASPRLARPCPCPSRPAPFRCGPSRPVSLHPASSCPAPPRPIPLSRVLSPGPQRIICI